MSRNFTTGSGIDIADGLLKGDRFNNKIEYKGEEVASTVYVDSAVADATNYLDGKIDANTQFIQDTSDSIQAQFDTYPPGDEAEGSSKLLLNGSGYSTYETRYLVPDSIDHLTIDTDDNGSDIYIEVLATRKKRLTVNHTYEDANVYIFTGLDNWSRDTAVLTHPTEARPYIRSGREMTFDLVPGEDTAAPELAVHNAPLGSGISGENFSLTSISGHANRVQKTGDLGFTWDRAYFIDGREYSGIIDGAKYVANSFGADSQTLTINSVGKVASNYIVRITNAYNWTGCGLNMPVSPTTGDTYILNYSTGIAITLLGNGNTFQGFKGSVGSFSFSGESLAIHYDGSFWQVDDIENESWGNLGISSGGIFYGNTSVKNANFTAAKALDSTALAETVAIGSGAGNPNYSAITGYTAIGANAGSALSTGVRNTFVGFSTGNSISIGQDNVLIGDKANGSANSIGNVAVGSAALSAETKGTSIGYKANAAGSFSITIGAEAYATNSYSIAIGSGASQAAAANSLANYAIAIGQDSGAVNVDAICIGRSSLSTGDYAVAIGLSAVARIGGVAVGYGAAAGTNNYATAIGAFAFASSPNSIAIGGGSSQAFAANALNTQATAIGYDSLAQGTYSVALGATSSATANYSIGIGFGSLADQVDSICIGRSADVGDQGTISIGTISSCGGVYSTAIGYSSNVNGGQSLAIGSFSNALSVSSIAIGGGGSAGTGAAATANYSIAIGYDSNADTIDSICIGRGTNINGDNSIAIGLSASASVSSVAIGDIANASNTSAVAIGDHASCLFAYGVAVGSFATVTDNYGVAIGGGTTTGQGPVADNLSIAIGNDCIAPAQHCIAMGYTATTSIANAVSIGSYSVANKINSLSLGYYARATADEAMALGTSSVAAGEMAIAIGGNNVLAQGATATGAQSIAIGRNAKASTTDGIAIGQYAESVHTNATIFGKNARSQFADTFHIGDTTTPMDLYVSGSLSVDGGFSAPENWSIDSTAAFTGTANKGYFLDTTGNAIAFTMPASPSIGDFVEMSDYNDTWNVNNVTVTFNGEPYNGDGASPSYILDIGGSSVKFVYSDATIGWKKVR